MAFIHNIVLFLWIYGTCIAADDEDAFDLSFLAKGAAVGDSYAAGIGAGNELDWSCSRYDGSYSYQVVQGIDTDNMDFTFTACSGAVISGVNDQVNALASDQDFIVMSAGGNDADLAGILNSCVYSFVGGLYHPSCDKKLAKSQAVITSRSFTSALSNLIDNAVTKLAVDGNIYYVGYAKFFDVQDNGCDGVSWHIWLNLFTREYLTQARRIAMNAVVDAMNTALRTAVEAAGSQYISFYDNYVDMINGRYCAPATDENSGNGANRPNLFFYEMKTTDVPWVYDDDDSSGDDLKRRQNSINDDGNIEPANATLNAIFGALVQEAIETDNYAAVLQADNADNDLILEVIVDEIGGLFARDVSVDEVIPSAKYPVVARQSDDTVATVSAASLSNETNQNRTPDVVRGSILLVGNYPDSANNTSVGTVIANSSHVLLANGDTVSKINIKKLIVSDKTSRVFHPTQGGHALIANLILYQMAAVNAQRLGLTSFPPFVVSSSGAYIPQIVSQPCQGASPDTWASPESIETAINLFCADGVNLGSPKGTTTSMTYNPGSLDYLSLSISWSENTGIGEHTCVAWLKNISSCDLPSMPPDTSSGGAILYQDNPTDINAVLRIQPLVVRQIWDGGQASVVDRRHCNDVATSNYIDQATLQENIADYCAASAAQAGGIANAGTFFTQYFNDGTPDYAALVTEWPSGPRNYQLFELECQYYMTVLSLPDNNNPMNWKHGGAVTDNNGITYFIYALQNRPPPPTAPLGHCTSSGFLLPPYYIDIYGGGFANSDKGQALRGQMNGCGNVRGWTFEYYDAPEADGTEWHASFVLGITRKGCVGRAIASAGGWTGYC